MDCSPPGFPVHHQLPKLALTHVHQVGDAIQPLHPLLSPSPPAFNQGLFQLYFNWLFSMPDFHVFYINPEYSLEGLMLKLKLWPPDAKSQPIGKDPDAGKD